MNAISAAPRSATTISLDCPWCDEPLALDDAFAATAIRCGSCATTIDIEPVRVSPVSRSNDLAA